MQVEFHLRVNKVHTCRIPKQIPNYNNLIYVLLNNKNFQDKKFPGSDNI